MKNIITIIIPIYNAEKNLKKCLDSILSQTYRKMEIICINDGSTDNSEQIINYYCKKDERIKIINKANTGVSDTRNIGIENANGDYIMFIDADDYISNNYIFDMISNAIDNECDLLVSGYTEISNFGESLKSEFYKRNDSIINITYPSEINKFFITSEFNPCWKQIIKKDLIIKNNIRFNTNIKYGEDMFFSLECYYNSKKTLYIKNFGYYYYINDSSVMNKKDEESLKKYYADNKLIHELIISKKIITDNEQLLLYKTLKTFDYISGKVVCSFNNYKKIRQIIIDMRKSYIVLFRKYHIFNYGDFKYKLLLFLLKYKLIYIYYLLRKGKLNYR